MPSYNPLSNRSQQPAPPPIDPLVADALQAAKDKQGPLRLYMVDYQVKVLTPTEAKQQKATPVSNRELKRFAHNYQATRAALKAQNIKIGRTRFNPLSKSISKAFRETMSGTAHQGLVVQQKQDYHVRPDSKGQLHLHFINAWGGRGSIPVRRDPKTQKWSHDVAQGEKGYAKPSKSLETFHARVIAADFANVVSYQKFNLQREVQTATDALQAELDAPPESMPKNTTELQDQAENRLKRVDDLKKRIKRIRIALSSIERKEALAEQAINRLGSKEYEHGNFEHGKKQTAGLKRALATAEAKLVELEKHPAVQVAQKTSDAVIAENMLEKSMDRLEESLDSKQGGNGRLSTGDTRLINRMKAAHAALPTHLQQKHARRMQRLLNHYALGTDPSRQPYGRAVLAKNRLPKETGAYILQPKPGKQGDYYLFVGDKTLSIAVDETTGEVVINKTQRFNSLGEALKAVNATKPAPQPSRAQRHLDAHTWDAAAIARLRNGHACVIVENDQTFVCVRSRNGDKIHKYPASVDSTGLNIVVQVKGKIAQGPTLNHILHNPDGSKIPIWIPRANGIHDLFHQDYLTDMIDNAENAVVKATDYSGILDRDWIVTPAGPLLGFYDRDMTQKDRVHFVGQGGIKAVADAFGAGQAMVVGQAQAGAEFMIDVDTLAELAREFKDHPHIAAGHVVEDLNGRVTVAEEFASGGDAVNIAFGDASRADRFQVIQDSCEGLLAMHEQDWVWLDGKPENLLIFADPKSGRPRAKNADFDLAQKASERVTSRTGTPFYGAPEMHAASSRDPLVGDALKRADVFSQGLMLFELYTGTELAAGGLGTGDREELSYAQLETAGFPTAEQAAKDPMLQLIRDMCNPQEPNRRPTMKQVNQRLAKMPKSVRK